MARVFEAMQKSGLKGTANSDPASTFMQFYDFTNETDPTHAQPVRPLPQEEVFNRHGNLTPGTDAEEGRVLDLEFDDVRQTATAAVPASVLTDEDPLRYVWDEALPQPGSLVQPEDEVLSTDASVQATAEADAMLHPGVLVMAEGEVLSLDTAAQMTGEFEARLQPGSLVNPEDEVLSIDTATYTTEELPAEPAVEVSADDDWQADQDWIAQAAAFVEAPLFDHAVSVESPLVEVEAALVEAPMIEAPLVEIEAALVEVSPVAAPVSERPLPEAQVTALATRAVTALAPLAPSLVVSTLPDTVREEFRRLRSSLLLAAENQQLQILMVCGIEAGDGASFVTRNLSLLLAEFDRINVARFELSGLMPEDRDAADQVTENYQMKLRRTEMPNLREILTTQGAVTLSELLRTCDTRAMISMLRERFDFVLIDAPAITANPDTALLASQVDGVILVAQQDETKCNSLAAARSTLQNARANILGVVLNRRKK